MSEPKMPTPEEMAKIAKSRTESDAELLKDGAEYVVDEKGDERLELTKEQIEDAKKEMEEYFLKIEKILNEREEINKSSEQLQREIDTLKRSMSALMRDMHTFTRMLYSSGGKGLDEWPKRDSIFELENTMRYIQKQLQNPMTDEEYKKHELK